MCHIDGYMQMHEVLLETKSVTCSLLPLQPLHLILHRGYIHKTQHEEAKNSIRNLLCCI